MFKSTCVLLLGFTTALAKMEGFVVGGSYAKIKHHSHSAFLSINCASSDGIKRGFICGSSIVNQNILLTAAHCLYGCTIESYIRVNLGSENRQRGQVLSSFSFVIHENYNPWTSANDICLIRTNKLIVFGDTVTRVAIMRKVKVPYNEKATVAGWGFIDASSYHYYVFWQLNNDNYYTSTGLLPKVLGATFCHLPVRSSHLLQKQLSTVR